MGKWSRRQRRTMLNAEGLEALLARRNWKKERFALLCEISPSQLSNLLSGRYGIRQSLRERMLKELPEARWEDLFFLESNVAEATYLASANNV